MPLRAAAARTEKSRAGQGRCLNDYQEGGGNKIVIAGAVRQEYKIRGCLLQMFKVRLKYFQN